MLTKALYNKLSAYFNLDNGFGKIRGIYTENNLQVQPIFDAWLSPFRDLGASTTTTRTTDGTDRQNLSMMSASLRSNSFKMPSTIRTHTHHTNMDVYDKVQKNDMMQAAVIMASFIALCGKP